jgi:hypothetical protein
MTYIRSPEAGMFICGCMAAVGFYGVFKLAQERWRRRRNWTADAKYRAFWSSQILPMIVWLGGSLIVLAICVQEYHDKLMHGP